ncbi:MAG: arginine--tRNA ligase [Candidatus Bathyarchaeota archaeon]|nr:arginine--tRNA ligase [Candidatus Bathyarchaeota archaeon]
MSVNPFADFRQECERILGEAIERGNIELPLSGIVLRFPPDPRFGQLSTSLSFEYAKRAGVSPAEIAKSVVAQADPTPYRLVDSVMAEGGYINFYSDLAAMSSLAIQSAQSLDTEYGYVKHEKPVRVIVEHTSANPISPIHIGAARNSVLGDSLARILKARGHEASRHYYIDDVGRQSAVISYGYAKLGRPVPQGKPDHFIGSIYSVASCLLEIQRLKREIEKRREVSRSEELPELQRRLDEWLSVAVELESKHPDIFHKMLDALEKARRSEDSETEVARLNREYEDGETKAKDLVRDVCEVCLKGFRQTLDRARTLIDSWDWESNFIWNGDVSRCLEALRRTPFVFQEGEVLEFDAEKVAGGLNLKASLGLREDYEVPSLTLGRADGTTLYTTRDVAYHIWKFKRANRVINVIGMEQKLAQLHLKLALFALGFVEEAGMLTHFAYNLVSIPGHRMSSRRGRYITFDDVMDGAVHRAYEEVSKRSPGLREEEKRRISELVGIGAVRFALVETDPIKPVVFTWDRVIDFERNSAPYIQYSHARACSILRKAAEIAAGGANYALLKEPLEQELILGVARFPEVFIDAADNLKPSTIADFAVALSDKFNGFYAKYPVIKAEPAGLSQARLALVDTIRITLRNSLGLIGIEAPERM